MLLRSEMEIGSFAERGSVFVERSFKKLEATWDVYRKLGLENLSSMAERRVSLSSGGIKETLKSLFDQGVNADYAARVHIRPSASVGSVGYSVFDALRMQEAGVPADYASVFERLYGDRRAAFAISFWEAGVPAEYGLLAFDTVHSIDGAIQMWKDGIPVEYLTVLTES